MPLGTWLGLALQPGQVEDTCGGSPLQSANKKIMIIGPAVRHDETTSWEMFIAILGISYYFHGEFISFELNANHILMLYHSLFCFPLFILAQR